MKKLKKTIAIGIVSLMLTSCATVFGGPVTHSQKTKPEPGQEQRKVRVAALILDILLFWPGAVIDFATGAIYKPDSSN